MNTSDALFPVFYDLLHAGQRDTVYYPQLLRPFGPRVLELGSGTGRIALPLAEAGYHVTGLELDPGMAAFARRKPNPGGRFTLLQGDARAFSLGVRFDAVILPCNLLFYFPDAGEVLSVLQNAARHTREGGSVVVDCSLPDLPAMAADDGREAVTDFEAPWGSILRDHFTPHFDFANQTETDDILLEEFDHGTLRRAARKTERLSWYLPREVRTLLRCAGLRIERESGTMADLSFGTPIGAGGEMIFLCTPERAE